MRNPSVPEFVTVTGVLLPPDAVEVQTAFLLLRCHSFHESLSVSATVISAEEPSSFNGKTIFPSALVEPVAR